GVAAEAHERGKRRILLRQADLEVVAGLAFVEEQGRHLGRVARRQVISVEIEGAGARTVRRALLVRAASLELLAERLVRPDHQARLGHGREQGWELGLDLLLEVVIALRQRFAALRLEFGTGADVVEELRKRAPG